MSEELRHLLLGARVSQKCYQNYRGRKQPITELARIMGLALFERASVIESSHHRLWVLVLDNVTKIIEGESNP